MRIAYSLSTYINLVDTIKTINRQLAPVVQKVVTQLVSLTLIPWIVIYPMDSAIHRLNNWGLGLIASKIKIV